LIPAGSRLLELPEVREMVGAFDAGALVYPWKNPRPMVDRLAEEAQENRCREREDENAAGPRRSSGFWRAANALPAGKRKESAMPILAARATVPISTSPGTV